MKATLRLGTTAGAGVLVVLLVGLVLVPWLGGPALFGTDAAALLGVVLREQARAGALDSRRELARRCIEGKGEVCGEVIAGRLTLAEAADRFERLDALLDDGQDDVAGALRPVRGRAEATASVLYWVSRSVEDPARRAEVLARLRRERDRLEANSGAVTTPPAGPTPRG